MTDKDILLRDEEVGAFLSEYFAYYNTLDIEWKKVFINRVIHFAQSKSFIGHQGFNLNNRVRVIVSASAVQLTLGLEVWDLHYFDTILLFPSDFFNHATRLNLKGETNLGGFISLSFKSFIQGYKIQNDNLNLGIHEFTHALRFNGVRGAETDYFFNQYFAKWYCFARKEFSNLNNNQPSIFRKYGGANINEFLSVAVEHFFESPAQFKQELPVLYGATAILLNQKTDGKTTKVNVRDEELKAQPLFVPLSPLSPGAGFFTTTRALVSLILFVFSIVTAISAGILSFPFLFLITVAAGGFILADYNYVKAEFFSDAIRIRNGFFLFKNRKEYSVKPNHIMSVEFFESNGAHEPILITFMSDDSYFYEENLTVKMRPDEKKQFIKELRQNFIWVKLPRA